MMMKSVWGIWVKSPECVKTTLGPFLRWLRFYLEFGFSPPPQGTDLVGYEPLLRFIERHNLLSIEGDIVEVGAFLGGGTYKISRYLERKRSNKKVYAIDIFDIHADRTMCTSGQHMSDIYADIVYRVGKGRSQLEIFQLVTRDCSGVVIIQGDSKKIEMPETHLCFAFVDGNHDSSYVRNDFHLVWAKLSQGGVIAFHDYGYDLPQVTKAIDGLLDEHEGDIEKTWLDEEKHIIFIKKEG